MDTWEGFDPPMQHFRHLSVKFFKFRKIGKPPNSFLLCLLLNAKKGNWKPFFVDKILTYWYPNYSYKHFYALRFSRAQNAEIRRSISHPRNC